MNLKKIVTKLNFHDLSKRTRELETENARAERNLLDLSNQVKVAKGTIRDKDKLYTNLPNLNSWLYTTFNRLNFMADDYSYNAFVSGFINAPCTKCASRTKIEIMLQYKIPPKGGGEVVAVPPPLTPLILKQNRK